jgi:hypothetical protein
VGSGLLLQYGMGNWIAVISDIGNERVKWCIDLIK